MISHSWLEIRWKREQEEEKDKRSEFPRYETIFISNRWEERMEEEEEISLGVVV